MPFLLGSFVGFKTFLQYCVKIRAKVNLCKIRNTFTIKKRHRNKNCREHRRQGFERREEKTERRKRKEDLIINLERSRLSQVLLTHHMQPAPENHRPREEEKTGDFLFTVPQA